MTPGLRLLLGLSTLTTFWLALFVAPMPSGADAAEEVVADAAALDALQVASREAYVEGRWQDALEPTSTLVKRFPGQHVYLARLAGIHHELQQPAEEAAAWEAFMERAPLPAEACPAIGQAYRRLRQTEKALDAFQRCFAADTKNAELAFFVGLGHEWLGKYEPAETFYQRALEIATEHQDSAVGLGRLRLHRNQYGQALALAQTVLAKSPSHVDALLVAGLAEQRAGHRREARGHLEKAVALSHDYFDIHLALGILEYTESHVAAARRHFETAQKLDAGRGGELQPWLERTAAARTTS